MMKPECLIFDLDNTLYDYNAPNKISIDAILTYFSKNFKYSMEEAREIFEKSRNQTHHDLHGQAASHNRILYFQKMLEFIGINSMKHASVLYNIYWDTFLNEMQLFENVEETLAMVKKKNIRVCILSDLTANIQFRKIKKTGLDKYVDFLVTSEEVGHEKPHPFMFKKALEKLKAKKEEVIMIGDNWKTDIEGASSFGIKSIWLNHENVAKDIPENVNVVHDFNEIGNILTAWN